MRYATAVRRLQHIADDAHQASLPTEDPLVHAIYTFRKVLEAPHELDAVDVALVADAPADELSWGAEPPWTTGTIERLRLNKSPVRWYFRPTVWPVWNHHIHQPLRIYSADGGPDKHALEALTRGDAQHLRLPAPSAAEHAEHVATELDVAWRHLRLVQQRYWDRTWRRGHKGLGVYPESHLWNAVWGYLDLHDAAQQLRL